jgi:hypothetical protein
VVAAVNSNTTHCLSMHPADALVGNSRLMKKLRGFRLLGGGQPPRGQRDGTAEMAALTATASTTTTTTSSSNRSGRSDSGLRSLAALDPYVHHWVSHSIVMPSVTVLRKPHSACG